MAVPLDLDLRVVGVLVAILGWSALAAAIAGDLVERRKHRRRRDDPKGIPMADNSVRIGLPAWTDQLAKHGPWVLLCFVLIYAMLYQPKPATDKQVEDGFREIQKAFVQVFANQAKIDNKMEEAQKVMYSAALQRNQRDERGRYAPASGSPGRC